VLCQNKSTSDPEWVPEKIYWITDSPAHTFQSETLPRGSEPGVAEKLVHFFDRKERVKKPVVPDVNLRALDHPFSDNELPLRKPSIP
jgi:hypothetical protein